MSTESPGHQKGISDVLVVDDSAFDRSIISRSLERLGVSQVRQAAGGLEAVSILIENPQTDVVLLDLMMPDMDGVQFLAALGKLDFAGGVVLISGVERQVLASAECLARERGLNVLGALAKPVIFRELEAVLASYHGPAKAAREPDLPLPTVDDLQRAIREREIEVFFQPKVRLSDARVMGVEALARWRMKNGTLLPPAAFIPMAEELRLIDTLSEVVLTKAMDHIKSWNGLKTRLPVAVNMSMVTLNNLDTRTWDLPDYIEEEARKRGLLSSDISVELTESRLMSDLVTPRETLTRLRLRGIGLSIDDFGTGYSSLAQLTRVPFGELKIDRGFVTGAVNSPDARSILESSVEIAKRFGLKTVAEGVETLEDWELVSSLGCDQAQGFFIAAPMAPEQVPEWVAGWEETHTPVLQ